MGPMGNHAAICILGVVCWLLHAFGQPTSHSLALCDGASSTVAIVMTAGSFESKGLRQIVNHFDPLKSPFAQSKSQAVAFNSAGILQSESAKT